MVTSTTDSNADILPISALQHFAYCPRQFALIHIEQSWEDNLFTAEGHVLHERVDHGESESRGNLYVARSIQLISPRLRLRGIADMIEFHRIEREGIVLRDRKGRWQPYPIEYKRGRSKTSNWDRVQLCAQALCLEEMLGVPVTEGAIYYAQSRRRKIVAIDVELRRNTEELIMQMHQLWAQQQTPTPEPGPKCDHCSLLHICMPHSTSLADSASAYLKRMLQP